jgi:transcriptional regulator with XRE-family HTH domain
VGVAHITASGLLRSTRTSRGLSQRALAAAAKVRQPGIASVESGTEDATVSRLEHLLNELGSQLTILPTRRRPVWAAGEDVRRALQADDIRTAWREVIQLNDDLRGADRATCVALAIAPPGRTGDSRFDALLAAVTDCALADARLPRPVWLDDKAWTLEEPWEVEQVPALQDAARKATPTAFRRHGVYLDRAVLQSI